jgi:hypothetical protein
MKPKGFHPALNRMGADPKLLNQQLGDSTPPPGKA